MKNIHVLPTDKPSRLKQNNITKKISLVNKGIDLTSYTPINIYITNDEEIKEGDWIIQSNFEKTNTQLIQCITEFQVKLANDKDGSFTKKKIILTTDQSLKGVQAINDEFLEWFVKNPSCEWVEVKCYSKFNDGDFRDYKIIIPKEEPKQEKMYSEEEVGELVYNIIGEYGKHYGIMIDGAKLGDLFKQFKNK